MCFRHRRSRAVGRGLVVLTLGLLFACGARTWASAEGEYLAGHVTVVGYFHLMDDLMYAHNGDDRGWGPEHDLARDNIYDHFESLGLDVSYHQFYYDGDSYYNVVATKPGSVYPDEVLILGAHFDSVNNPGADDNASGVCAVMHAAWILARAELQRTVTFIAFDREEQGLYGSYYYASDHSGDDIVGMVSLDMVAYNHNGNDHADIYGRSASDPIKSAVADAVEFYGGLTTSLHGEYDASDHAPFEWFGFQACLLIEDWGNPYYHSPQDSIDTLNYLDFVYAANMTRAAVGFAADQAGIVTLPCWSDLTGDQTVNVTDFTLFATAYGSNWTTPSYDPLADMNGDGYVNATDFTLFAAGYLQPCP